MKYKLMNTKTLRFLAAFIVIVALNFKNANAQTQTVGSGFAYTYSVTDHGTGFTYQWQVYNAANTAPAAGTAYAFDATYSATTFNPRITWNTPGTYTLRATESNNSCPGSTSIITVVVTNQPTIAISTSDLSTCSTTAQVSLNVTYTNTASIRFPISVTYTLGGVAQTPISIANSTATFDLPTNFGQNSGATDLTKTIIITSVADNVTAPVGLGTDVTYVRTIYATPSTTPITYQ